MNTLLVLGLGVLRGMRHATEADHLAAVATLAGRERSFGQGLRLGVAWGCGHTLTPAGRGRRRWPARLGNLA